MMHGFSDFDDSIHLSMVQHRENERSAQQQGLSEYSADEQNSSPVLRANRPF